MSNEPTVQSRKKFITAGISAAALLTAFRFFILTKKKKNNTIKMLTQDGVLVEVDAEKIIGSRKKQITDNQLKTWVNKKHI